MRQENIDELTWSDVRCRALSTRCDEPEKASRPWDQNRDGFVMGEGAGVFVMESLDHAQKRGANILAEYLGGAFTCDAHHMTDPRPDGLGVSSCIELALSNSGVDRDQVGDWFLLSIPQVIVILQKAYFKVLKTTWKLLVEAQSCSKISLNSNTSPLFPLPSFLISVINVSSAQTLYGKRLCCHNLSQCSIDTNHCVMLEYRHI